MILKLENTTTHQTYEYSVDDMNNGEKLYFRFNINTLSLDDGEYNLTLLDGDKVVCTDILKIGDFNPSTLQYKRGENTYIAIELDAKIESKNAQISDVSTVIYPNAGYDGMDSVIIDAQPLYDIAFEEGNVIGYDTGKQVQKELLEPVTITENGVYSREDGYSKITVEVPDLNGSFDEGYQQGKEDGYDIGREDGYNTGKQEQKELLEPITITENGVYSRENGYSQVTVEVPDLNGSYDDGYSDGIEFGYNTGYDAGIAEGTANAGEIIAETARVLDITENGVYTTQYTQDEDYLTIPDLVTGVFPDGTNFYNWADIKDGHFNTNVCPTANSRVEFWWKPAEESKGYHYQNIFGAGLSDNNGRDSFEIHYFSTSRTEMRIKIGTEMAKFTIDNTVWNHIVIDNGSLFINDELKATLDTSTYVSDGTPLIINSSPARYTYNGNGLFGMFKIDDHIFIPSKDGFINYETGQLLTGYLPTDATKPFAGIYNFVDNFTKFPAEGNLIRTISVNVKPKINVAEAGIKFAYSSFATLPEWADFSNVTDMSDMFRSTQLATLKGIEFSTVQNMNYAFYGCHNLTNLDYFIPSKSLLYMNNSFDSCTNLRIIPNLDLSSVLNAGGLFESCGSIEEIGDINFENVTNIDGFLRNYGNGIPIRKIGVFNVPNLNNINDFFYYSFTPVIRDNLTEMGGFIGLKCNWNGGNGLDSCPNLTYQSCINILNGLADVTDLGGRTLKVHHNFLTTVGDEITIATNKGWNVIS